MGRQRSKEDYEDISKLIHQAALNPHMDSDMLNKICDASKQNGFAGLCTSLSHLKIARKRLGSKNDTKLISIIAFPFGLIPTHNKLKEAEYAIEEGAEELDLVPNFHALNDKNNQLFAEEINLICELGIPVRVIVDANSLLASKNLSIAINASIEAGAKGIQSGNGFGPPTTSVQIKKLAEIIKNRCSIKAVGGIKTFNQAREIVQAGATQIGTSFGFELVQGQKDKTQ